MVGWFGWCDAALSLCGLGGWVVWVVRYCSELGWFGWLGDLGGFCWVWVPFPRLGGWVVGWLSLLPFGSLWLGGWVVGSPSLLFSSVGWFGCLAFLNFNLVKLTPLILPHSIFSPESPTAIWKRYMGPFSTRMLAGSCNRSAWLQHVQVSLQLG